MLTRAEAMNHGRRAAPLATTHTRTDPETHAHDDPRGRAFRGSAFNTRRHPHLLLVLVPEDLLALVACCVSGIWLPLTAGKKVNYKVGNVYD